MKYERDGKVAILYSPNFGAGWSTWADPEQKEYLLFDSELVQLVLSEDRDGAAKLAESKYEHLYTGGARDLEVAWLDKGQAFTIEEYDGCESIRTVVDLAFTA